MTSGILEDPGTVSGDGKEYKQARKKLGRRKVKNARNMIQVRGVRLICRGHRGKMSNKVMF